MLDGSRVGNWPHNFGVGSQGNLVGWLTNFPRDYDGLDCIVAAAMGEASKIDALFVDYQGTTSGPTAGAGGGDYALQSGSPAKGMVAAVLRFDAAGVERSALTSAGAYE